MDPQDDQTKGSEELAPEGMRKGVDGYNQARQEVDDALVEGKQAIQKRREIQESGLKEVDEYFAKSSDLAREPSSQAEPGGIGKIK